jgi:4-hydroxy-tetrahydrodipicolinate synthase
MVKEAMRIVGFDCGGVRLPLIDATPEQRAGLEEVMRAVGVL